MSKPVTDKQSLTDIALHAVRAANPDARCIVLVLDEDPSLKRCIGARGVSKADTIDELCAAAKRLLDDGEAGGEP